MQLFSFSIFFSNIALHFLSMLVCRRFPFPLISLLSSSKYTTLFHLLTKSHTFQFYFTNTQSPVSLPSTQIATKHICLRVRVCLFVCLCVCLFRYVRLLSLLFFDTMIHLVLPVVCLCVCVFVFVVATKIKLRNIKPIKITFKIVYFSCTPRVCLHTTFLKHC